ncbi:MAG: CDP-alcohol phosphatidyltransferase family protein [Syntrophobacteraceae bacterium]
MVKSAIIVAPDDSGLQPLFGIPVVRRLVLILRKLGIGSIHVIGRTEALRPVLTGLIPPRFFQPADGPDAAVSAADRLDLPVDGRVAVLRANHAVDSRSLGILLRAGDGKEAAIMSGQGDRIGDGAYVAPPSHLAAVIRALWLRADEELQFPEAVARVPSIDGLPYSLDGTAQSSRAAEGRLVGALSAHTRADDGFMARHFDRRLSQMMSRRLAHTAITPNQVTLVGMSMGLFAAFLLSLPGYWAHLAGAILFVFCIIVDGVDGEIARLKLQESAFGHYLDIVTDNIVHGAIFVGVAFGLYHDTGNDAYVLALWFLLGGFILSLIAVYQCILRLSPEELERSPRLIRLMAFLSNRDFAYLIAVLALFGKLDWFLIGASAGSYLFAIGLWAMSFHEKRRRSSADQAPHPAICKDLSLCDRGGK